MSNMNSAAVFKKLEQLSKAPVILETFPSHFSVVMRLQQALNREESSFNQICHILNNEPVVAARVMQHANSALYHDYEPITNLTGAVSRLGLKLIRRLALMMAYQQLNQSKAILGYANLSRQLWIQSIYSSSVSQVFAKETASVPPEEALFTGLVLNIGAFYLLYKVGREKTIVNQEPIIRSWISDHGLRITHQLARQLRLPTVLIEAVDLKQQLGQAAEEYPRTLKEVIYIAHLLANRKYPLTEDDTSESLLPARYLTMDDTLEHAFKALQSSQEVT